MSNPTSPMPLEGMLFVCAFCRTISEVHYPLEVAKGSDGVLYLTPSWVSQHAKHRGLFIRLDDPEETRIAALHHLEILNRTVEP